MTSLLNQGGNAIGILLGNGFYNVQGGRYRKLQISFGAPTLFFKLIMKYTDGTQKEVLSGADWKYSLSPITFNCSMAVKTMTRVWNKKDEYAGI